MSADDRDCTCEWVDPAMWFTYYGAVEPGSTLEFDPECPVHACPEPGCGRVRTVVEKSIEEQIVPDRRIGGPPSFRACHVTRLACGHEIATEVAR